VLLASRWLGLYLAVFGEMEAKKRKLQEDETGFVERFAEAQEKSLAQNLYRYKRHIQQLTAKVVENRTRSYGISDLLASLDRVLKKVGSVHSHLDVRSI
jgi:uncharacterized membrane protein